MFIYDLKMNEYNLTRFQGIVYDMKPDSMGNYRARLLSSKRKENFDIGINKDNLTRIIGYLLNQMLNNIGAEPSMDDKEYIEELTQYYEYLTES